jgi:molybdenum cofactor cytidylyltransferase
MLSLLDAVGRCPTTAVVGAGGKTSTLFRLAREYHEPVFLANSAHLGVSQLSLVERCYCLGSVEDLPDFTGGVPPGISLFHGKEIPGRGRVSGLDEHILDALRRHAGWYAVPLLIEADGARGLPLKAPAEHEPPIPPFTDCVVVCAGLRGLGHAIDEKVVFRPEIYAALATAKRDQEIDETMAARVLCHSSGGMKNIPPGARRVAVLNQADDMALGKRGAKLARFLLRSYAAVAVCALHGPAPDTSFTIHAVYRPTAGIVLAAGAAQRFGRLKQLLSWQGETLVRRAARTAVEAGLDPVVVVTGAHAPEVEAELVGLRVVINRCSEWQSGQSASIKAGLGTALDSRPDLDGALFLLCDQPFVDAEVVEAVVDLRSESQAEVCAPFAAGRRCNPVLFSRPWFNRLMALEGDEGGRQALEGMEVALVSWGDNRLAEDIDTPEDFDRLTMLL